MRNVVMSGLILCLSLGTAVAEEPKPAVDGPRGKAAFEDLAGFYANPEKEIPFQKSFADLKSDDAAVRVRAGEYLLALFKQSWADENNGRAPWQQQPYFGGGSVSPAREFRKKLAEVFGKQAEGEAALDAVAWLLETERLPDSQAAAVTALRRIRGDKANAALGKLVSPPHPCAMVAQGAIEEIGERKLKESSKEILALCGHHRTALREAARKAAGKLELGPIPDYDPEKAFTPALEKQLADIITMIEAKIPKDARWATLTRQVPVGSGEEKRTVTMTGWVVGEADGRYKVVDWFGDEESLPKEGTEVTEIKLSETAEHFHKLRSASGEDAMDALGALSRRGMLTGQFQPRFISAPEIFVGAWALDRGDRKAAAATLFDRIDEMRDDRWLMDIARDMLGHQYHQAMLIAFCYHRDYDRTLALAKHLSQPVFDGYQYQPRAKNLAKQLPNRRDDFKTFKLPTPDEWKEQQTKLTRAEQIKFLAERLRLLNCQQWGQPGGIEYSQEQTSTPFKGSGSDGVPVINPVTELEKLKLEVADLPALVPYLGSEDYMLCFSYWRDFHPSRTLHQVNWVVVDLVNDAAKKDLADLATYNQLDDKGKKAHLDKILTWCKENAGKSREQLLLDVLENPDAMWKEIERAAAELVSDKNAKALPLLVAKVKTYPKHTGAIAQWCSELDSPDAVEPARTWVKSEDASTRFWSALILLRHGDKAKAEGMEPLKEVLAKDDGSYLYPRAIDPLLAVRSDEALKLACAILKKDHFHSDHNRGEILRRLFLAGRTEALDYLNTALDDTEKSGTSSGTYKGKKVQRSQVVADGMANDLAGWHTDDWTYERLAPDEDRKEQREQLKTWLKEQFQKIKAGEKPNMRTEIKPMHFPEWQLDAP